jgi:hypothetical protein
MGVEAVFYGYDEAWFETNYPQVITINMLLNTLIVSEEFEIMPQFVDRIQEIDTLIGSNKQWYNNLCCEDVYSKVREYLPADLRRHSDNLFNLLFWERDRLCSDRPQPIEQPIYDRESYCWLYSAATVSAIAAIAFNEERLRLFAPGYIANWPITGRSEPALPDFQLEDLRPFFDRAITDWPIENRDVLELRNNDDFNTFSAWVYEWLMVFGKVAILGRGQPWALMIYLSW